MACGESTRAYGNRMDNMWALRAAFAMARGFRDAQDAFCARVEAGLWDEVAAQSYPEDYRWEALVDVLRGKAKVCVYIISITFCAVGGWSTDDGRRSTGLCAVRGGGGSGRYG